MFLCANCHRKASGVGPEMHFGPPSRGPCEDCGFTELCVDCKCYRNQPALNQTGAEAAATIEDLKRLREELA